MKTTFLSAAADAIRNVFTPEHIKLGVPKDFPIRTFVYPSPIDYPLNDPTAVARFFLATYEGGDSWFVEDLEWAPHEMGTDMLPGSLGNRSLTSKQLVAEFDQHILSHPMQGTADYGSERHYMAARDSIIGHFVPSLCVLEHKAA